MAYYFHDSSYLKINIKWQGHKLSEFACWQGISHTVYPDTSNTGMLYNLGIKARKTARIKNRYNEVPHLSNTFIEGGKNVSICFLLSWWYFHYRKISIKIIWAIGVLLVVFSKSCFIKSPDQRIGGLKILISMHKNSHQRRWQIPRPKSNWYAVTSSQPSIYIWCDNTECHCEQKWKADCRDFILPLNSQASSYKVHSREITYKSSKGEQQFLNARHPLDLLYIYTIYYQNISKDIKVIERTSFPL